MSTGGRRVFALVAATVAVFALAGAVVYATTVDRGEDEAQTEPTTIEVTTEQVEGAKLRKVSNNKGKSAPGMCVYNEEDDELSFERVPKGNMDEDDPVLDVLDQGGDFADSQADCDELNEERAEARANPPENHNQTDVREETVDPAAGAKIPPAPKGAPSSEKAAPPREESGNAPSEEAIEAREALEKRQGGEPKAKN